MRQFLTINSLKSKINVRLNTNFYRVYSSLIKQYPVFCEQCFSFKSTVIHHKDKNKKNNQENNLLPLCRKCHTLIHYPHKNKNNKIRIISNIKIDLPNWMKPVSQTL